MHEIAIAEGILSVVLEAAQERKVRSVHVHAGRMQWIVLDSLQFAFDMLAENSPAHGAAVHLETIQIRVQCKKCGKESILEGQPIACSHCNDFEVEILNGMELMVDSVELENGEIVRNRPVVVDGATEEHLKEHFRHDG